MDIREFYEELEKIKNSYQWSLIKERNKLVVRACVHENIYCPISALAHSKTGKIFPISYFEEAGALLGLNLEDSKKITVSSDGWKTHEFYSEEVRNKLISILELPNPLDQIAEVVQEKFLDVKVRRDYHFLNIEVKSRHVAIEYRPNQGYGLIGNREILPFEGPDEIYKILDEVKSRVLELLRSGQPTKCS